MTPEPHTANADISNGGVRVRASLPTRSERSGVAAVISFAVHLGLILLLIRVGVVVGVERGALSSLFDQQPGGGGGGGTGGVAFISIPPPPPPPPPPEQEIVPPTAVPTVIPEVKPEPELKPVATPPPDSVPAGPPGGTKGTGGGSGGGEGTGTGTGTGSGVGPGSGGGTGGGTGGGGKRGTPPEARQLIVPPIDDVPKSLRGKTVEVTFSIDAFGTVRDVDVAPPISDRKFSAKFDETMRNYRFHPARDAEGIVVAGVITVTVTF